MTYNQYRGTLNTYYILLRLFSFYNITKLVITLKKLFSYSSLTILSVTVGSM